MQYRVQYMSTLMCVRVFCLSSKTAERQSFLNTGRETPGHVEYVSLLRQRDTSLLERIKLVSVISDSKKRQQMYTEELFKGRVRPTGMLNSGILLESSVMYF